jgi:periodic tryptophan protein 1
VAGSRGQLQVWDTSTNASVRNVFGTRVKLPEDAGKGERMIGVNDSDSESDDEEGIEEGGMAVEEAPDGWESMEED